MLEASFDRGDWIEIAWLFGHEAGRLGLSKDEMPTFMAKAINDDLRAAG
jgi:hypothetical protein